MLLLFSLAPQMQQMLNVQEWPKRLFKTPVATASCALPRKASSGSHLLTNLRSMWRRGQATAQATSVSSTLAVGSSVALGSTCEEAPASFGRFSGKL